MLKYFHFIVQFLALSFQVKIITKGISPDEYGLYSYILVFFLLSSQIGGNFYYPGLLREWQALLTKKGALIFLRGIVVKVLLISCFISLIFFVIFLYKYEIYLTVLVAFYALLKASTRFFNQVLNLSGMLGQYLSLESSILLGTVIYLYSANICSINSVLTALIIGQLVQITVQILMFFKHNFVTAKSSTAINVQQVTLEIKKFSAPFILSNVIVFAIQQGDKYFIGNIFSVERLGIYAANYQLTWTPFVLASSILGVLLKPIMYDDTRKKEFTISRTIRVYLLVILLFSLLVYPFIVKYFVDKYFDYKLVLLLVVTGLLNLCTSIFELILLADRQTKRLFYTRNVIFIVGFILSVVYYNIYAQNALIALPLLLTYFIYTLCLIYYVKNSTLRIRESSV